MILSIDGLWSRAFTIFTTQLFLGIFSFFLAYKLLKRKRSRATLTLSGFYILSSGGFLLTIVLVLIPRNPEATILYTLIIILISFSLHFLVLSAYLTLKTITHFSLRYQLLVSLIYLFLAILLYGRPNAFTLNAQTNWFPIINSTQFIYAVFYITIGILIPLILIFRNQSKRITDRFLKKRMRLFYAGIFLNLTLAYGGLIYNMWVLPVFNQIWTFFALINILGPILIYFGIGRDFSEN